MSLITSTLKIKRARKAEHYFIFQFTDNQMIAFNTETLKLIAFNNLLDTWQPIIKTNDNFDPYIQTIIAIINEQNALSNSTLYQKLLQRS